MTAQLGQEAAASGFEVELFRPWGPNVLLTPRAALGVSAWWTAHRLPGEAGLGVREGKQVGLRVH